MVTNKIQQIFAKTPEVKYGYADISYSSFSEEYRTALVLAVPYEEQLNLAGYTEEGFEKCTRNAKKKTEVVLSEMEALLKEEHIKYYIPSAVQQNEEELLAEFSFKYAAVKAGLGWIGKNDVLITEEYGPRVRLAAILLDYAVEYDGKIMESKCASCNRCVDICPHKALKGFEWNINARRSELIDFHLCSQKRSAYIEKHGRKNACGLCLVVCPFGMES